MPMMPLRVTQTGLSTGTNGFTQTFFPDVFNATAPFNVSIATIVNSTSLTYSVQHSYDYTGSSDFVSSNANWFTSTSFSSVAGVNSTGGYTYPVTAIRLYVTATTTSSATNTVGMTCIPAG